MTRLRLRKGSPPSPLLKPAPERAEAGFVAPDVEDLDWRLDALCASIGSELFFPEKGGDVKSPRRICQLCEVGEECLLFAIDREERFGIWGGETPRARKKLATQDKFMIQLRASVVDRAAHLNVG